MQLCMRQHLSRKLALCTPQCSFCSRLFCRCLLHASHLHDDSGVRSEQMCMQGSLGKQELIV